MANLHDYACGECTDPNEVGVGTGETADGEKRIVVTLPGPPLPGDPDLGWRSLSLEAARELYDCLAILRHMWKGVDSSND